jgi:hypothetical protein
LIPTQADRADSDPLVEIIMDTKQRIDKSVVDVLQSQSITIAKRGKDVILACDNHTDANLLFQWILSLASGEPCERINSVSDQQHY